jgi:thiol-disulfide isomerase/thioredoxin
MKHIYSLFACLLIGTATFAQLPNGSIAPDFTATDIDGVEHNLYDLLDEGKKVIIDFSATWCGPCWNYHTNGVFEELYETYGPDGTDELRIFWIEADDTTTEADLNGTGTATQGDWVTGTSFPIIDDGGSIFDDYAGAYYPTIYTVCPNRIVTESGQVDVAGHAAIFQANDCAAASLPNDPALLSYTGGTTACPGEPVNLSVEMMNLGVSNLQYCTIAVMEGGTELLSYDWSGNLDTYGIVNVDLGSASFDASTDFTIEITSGDDNDVNNSSTGAVELATEGTSLIKVEIMTDNWPAEISWNISDDGGNVIESVEEGEVSGSEGDVIVWWVSVPETGCYTFTMNDAYGDGLAGEQWGSIAGSCTVKTYNDDLTFISTIFDYDGSYDFESVAAGMSVTSVNVSIEEQSLNQVTRVFPNPFVGQTNLQFSTIQSGAASIVVYNLVGEQLINDNLGTLAAGEYNHVIDFNGVSAGVYLIHLTAGGETTTMRATLK